MTPNIVGLEKSGRQYWILKTTEGGPTERNHWCDFKKDSVVAVGWPIKENPTKFSSLQEFSERLNLKYDWPNNNANYVASQIYKFANCWRKDDIAIVCVGYRPHQEQRVCLYGFAVVGDFLPPENRPKWRWRFKRQAEIKVIEKNVPVRTFIDAFGKKSMLQTIHGPFTQEQFHKFSKAIQRLYPELRLD